MYRNRRRRHKTKAKRYKKGRTYYTLARGGYRL